MARLIRLGQVDVLVKLLLLCGGDAKTRMERIHWCPPRYATIGHGTLSGSDISITDRNQNPEFAVRVTCGYICERRYWWWQWLDSIPIGTIGFPFSETRPVRHLWQECR